MVVHEKCSLNLVMFIQSNHFSSINCRMYLLVLIKEIVNIKTKNSNALNINPPKNIIKKLSVEFNRLFRGRYTNEPIFMVRNAIIF